MDETQTETVEPAPEAAPEAAPDSAPLAETAPAEKDPFDLLMDAGRSPDLWLLVGGPAALLVAIIAIYALVIAIRNRRERRELEKEMALEDKEGGKSVVAGAPRDREPEDYGDVQPYEVPHDLEAESLEAEEPEEGAGGVVEAPGEDVEDVRRTDRASWLKRLRGGLAKTRDAFAASLGSIFTGKVKIDSGVLERLHEGLYRADVGVATTDKLVDHVRATLGREEAADWAAVSQALRERAAQIMAGAQAPVAAPPSPPWVILVVGVNGVGKTTTIGKLAAHFLAQDKTVLLAAADTFRAAAIEQLSVWGDRLGVDVVKHKAGADPAAVAYDAVKAAMARGVDVLLIDTAGRLHNKNELMAELGKINRVIGKDLPGAPHETWLVIDATTGQNAVVQVKAFREVVNVSGLVVTKLDGTAKGGVLLGITDQFGLPLRYLGVGEKASDLRAFDAKDYVESLF